MQLNVHISSATDGYFLLKAAEIPELTARASKMDGIPGAVLAAAAELTGRPPEDFNINIDY